jgi:4'-phosphopantetheinyl transferase
MKIELYGNRELLHMGKLELHTRETHIWKLRWRELETFWEWHKHLLERQECQKAEHYRFYEDKIRYLAGKIALKMLLKEYSGVDKIVFSKGKYGKLYWKAPPGQREITFNLSHSGEWVLAIFACQQAVGIDVQKTGEIPEYMEIAEKFFAAEEEEEIREAGNSERFYQYWAAKEAYLKALGIGLNRGMNFFSVRGNRIIENGKVKSGWKLYPILIKDYAAYAAIQEKGR